MEKMLVWMMLWIPGVLGQTDMKGKLFAFPNESSTSYVRLFPDLSGPFEEATVCMRFQSNLTRDYSIFSLATPRKQNDFHLFYYPGLKNQLELWVGNTAQTYNLQFNDFTEWTSLCAAWSSSAWVVWIDGEKYKEDTKPNVKISAKPIIIIGQDQDSYGGGFDKTVSFVGEVTDINMWDKALTDENIMDYFADNGISGNVINWNALRYNRTDDVTIRPYADPYPCIPV